MERRDDGERVSLRDLSKLYWLGVQVKEIEQRIAELEREEKSASGHTRCRAELTRLRDRLWTARRRCLEEELRLRAFIERVDDPQMQVILTLRFVRGKSWLQIAREIGGGNTEDGVKKACYRWMKNGEKRGNDTSSVPAVLTNLGIDAEASIRAHRNANLEKLPKQGDVQHLSPQGEGSKKT